MSPMFGERALRSPVYGGASMPPDIAKIDAAIGGLDFYSYEVIRKYYVDGLNYRRLAKHFQVKLWSVSRILRDAEKAVHSHYTKGMMRNGISSEGVHV
jgi:DNA-directed RNA polymerase specialized sigma24 family protein